MKVLCIFSHKSYAREGIVIDVAESSEIQREFTRATRGKFVDVELKTYLTEKGKSRFGDSTLPPEVRN